ncbi:phosphopantetheine-binding protein [Sulfurospirillum arcachonense]|uniref:phosphopantetheine-binding protein n=1 Tax=Sulfurospirillum arcachonense TaxID=57666 RepID=UPI00046953A2|nr:phosphopantetheine-binding protein [Sulfurospirillum arcachonense]
MITGDQLKEVIIKNLKLEDIEVSDIEDDMALFGEDGLGLDSVDSIELVLTLEKEFGVKVADSKEYENIFATSKTLLDYINANQ